jgi:hypothetical protein
MRKIMRRFLATLLFLFFTNALYGAGYFGVEGGGNSVFGFYGGNIPEKNHLGFYIDLKGSLNSPNDKDIYSFTEEYATQTLGDSRTGVKYGWTIINVAASYQVLENFLVLAGGGYGSKEEYKQFHDPTGILGTNNTYYIRGKNLSSPNLMLGGLVIIERINIKLSYDSFPKTINFGIGMNF